MHKLAKVIGTNVERIRKGKGLTQPEFGELCKPKISQPRLSKIENGEKLITIKTVEQLAKALEVRPFELLIDRSVETSELKQLAEMVELLPKKEQKSVYNILSAVLRSNGLIG